MQLPNRLDDTRLHSVERQRRERQEAVQAKRRTKQPKKGQQVARPRTLHRTG